VRVALLHLLAFLIAVALVGGSFYLSSLLPRH
jgi:hypothetical protein